MVCNVANLSDEMLNIYHSLRVSYIFMYFYKLFSIYANSDVTELACYALGTP